MNSNRNQIITICSLILIVVAVIINAITNHPQPNSILGLVDVNASVADCSVLFLVHPEKRLPPTGNWSETIYMEVYDANTTNLVFSDTVISDSAGQARSQLCPIGIFTEGGNYDVYIKGLSHLARLYPAITFTGIPTIFVNLTSEPDLLAGDTDLPAGDNVVTYNDIRQLTINLYSNNQRNDLNRDGKVNSLDLSNMITNLNLNGD